MLKTKKILSVLMALVMMLSAMSVVANATSDADNVINTAEIIIDTDIGSVDAGDYESYIEILTEGLEFEDNYNDPAVFVYDSEGNDFCGEFKVGETYCLSVYLSPETEYCLAKDVAGYVNGEEVDTRVSYWIPGEEYGFVRVDYVLLQYELTVTEEAEVEEPGFFARIIEFFRNLFAIIFGIIG